MTFGNKLGNSASSRRCKTKGCSKKVSGTIYYCRTCRYNFRMKKKKKDEEKKKKEKDEEKKLPELTCHLCGVTGKDPGAHTYCDWMCPLCRKTNLYLFGMVKYGDTTPPYYPPVDEYEDFELEVTYAVDEDGHSGYCSDPGEFHTTTSYETHTLPLVRSIKTSDLDEENESVVSKMIELYNLEMLCGSGVCGCYTRYTVVDNKVVKRGKRRDDFVLT